MMNSEDARSDFVLAAAGAVLLPYVANIVRGLPGHPSSGTVLGRLLTTIWVGLALMLVPIIIARFREEGASAFGLAGSRDGLRRAAVVGAPIVVLGFLRSMSLVGPLRAIGGRFGIPITGSPTVGAGFDPFDIVLRVLYLGVLAVGTLVLIGFLINRAPDAFRSPDLSVVEGLRTFGMGAAAASLLFGLLAVVSRGVQFNIAVAASVALVATVLLADRLVVPGMTTTRASIVAPAAATAVFHVLSTGNILGGDLVLLLWLASLGFGLVVVAASLARTGKMAIAFAVPVLAATIYPTCMSSISILQDVSGGFCPI